MNKIITEFQEKERDWRYKTALKKIIEEIQPRRRGPRRKKKAEIIPEISEKKVV